MRIEKDLFLDYFKNSEPMRYYEGDTNSVKAQDMINNKDNMFTAMEKRDGEWCRAIIYDGGVLLQSRSISKVTGTYGDKTEHVPHIIAELLQSFPAGTVLLGELAFGDRATTSKDVGSILRCKAPKAIERQKNKKLEFFIFDVLAYDYEVLVDKPFNERFLAYPEYADAVYFRPVLNHSGSTADFMEFADWVWSHGGEGIMIVRNDMKYAPGKRTAWQSLKVKKKLGTLEAKVIDFIEPNKSYEGSEVENWNYWTDDDGNLFTKERLALMTYINNPQPVTKPYFNGWKNGIVVEYEGRIVKVTSGMTDELREYLSSDIAKNLLKDEKLYAKISGMEITEDSIRHPILLEIFKK